MHLRTGIVAIVLAAATGAAVARALTEPRAGPVSPAALPFVASSDGAVGMRGTGVATAPGNRGATGRAFASGRARPHSATPLSGLIVYVAGAVAKPGVYHLPVSARAIDALHAAGGPKASADLVAVNLASRVEDGEEIAVPVRGAPASASDGAAAEDTRAESGAVPRRHRKGRRRKRHVPHRASTAAVSPSDGSETDGSPGEAAEMVDINAADESTLETLPGIGPSLARRLVAFRDLNGPFASSDELLDVGGLTAAKVDALRPYITF